MFNRLGAGRENSAGLLGLLLLLLVAGCASVPATDPKRVAQRRAERAAAYQSLTEEQRALVDQGQIKTGMSEDAVYIAWGAPAEKLQSENATGATTTWLYHGTTSDDYVHWNYREVVRKDGSVYLDRYMDRDVNFRSYVSAELVFRGGRLEAWRTLPKPPGNTYFSPGPTPWRY